MLFGTPLAELFSASKADRAGETAAERPDSAPVAPYLAIFMCQLALQALNKNPTPLSPCEILHMTPPANAVKYV